MKIKFNLKLTISLVSLFIGLVLIVVGNNNDYCLSFGFILMGLSMGVYAMYKSDLLDSVILEVRNEIENTDLTDTFTLQSLHKEKKKLTTQKQKLNFLFYFTACLLIFVGIYFII